jgi:hypothetical protein
MRGQVDSSIVVLRLGDSEGFSSLTDLHLVGAQGNKAEAQDKEYKDHEHPHLKI